MTTTINQFSTVNALMSGLYDGFFPVAQIRKCGQLGLGCSHALAGEVTILQDRFFEATGTGDLGLMAESDRLPFAQITTFTPEENLRVQNITKDNLHDRLASRTAIDNLFLAITLEGSFSHLTIRRPTRQEKPYKSVLDVVAEQIVDELTDIQGTLIGFWSPRFFDKISVPGFHLHFVSSDHLKGGHVIDFNMREGSLAYETKFELSIQLPDDPQYRQQDLNINDMEGIIKHVEN